MKTLTPTQYELLTRLADGELDATEQVFAKKLGESPQGVSFLNELATLRAAAQSAEEAIWAKSSLSAEQILSGLDQPALNSLEDLKPMLERFFDGECDDVESEWVAELIDSREDVLEYVSQLDTLRASVRVAEESVASHITFQDFWSNVEGRLDVKSFGVEEKVLITRYFDNEVTNSERDSAKALLESHPEAQVMLDCLGEVNLATVAALDVACEGVDFGSIWSAVESAMDEDQEAKGENVVSLGKRRRENESFFVTYRQSIFGAVAALVAVAFLGSLFGPLVLNPTETVIVEKTIVIVDSVESLPGASVMINSPVKRASSISEPGSDTEEPTVIWLLDSGDDNVEEESETPSGQPI